MNYEKMLLEYKLLIDFNDQMEKNNFKYISNWVSKKTLNEKEKEDIISDVIDIHKRYMCYKKNKKNKDLTIF